MNKMLKRERSVNFTLEERDVLVSLVVKYKDILENKQTDATTWKSKELAWTNIEKDFNARSGGAPRTSKGLKRSVRKKSAIIRSEMYRTGGGTNTAAPLDNTEEKIKKLISLSTDGLESLFDSDVLPQTQESQDGMDTSMDEFQVIVIPSTPTAESGLPENVIDCKENSQEDIKVLPSTSSQQIVEDIIITDNAAEEDPYEPTPRKMSKTPSSSLKWDLTSRRNLKTKKHPALIGHFGKRSIDEYTQSRLELIEIQKEVFMTDMIEKKKESDFKEKQRKLMEEEQLLKIEILKKQLQILTNSQNN